MAKSSNKTVPNNLSVEEYLQNIENTKRKADCETISAIMKKVTNREPKMWGTSIVGFGTYHYKYESGREGIMLITGFSNRKQAITLYIMGGFKRYDELLGKLGPFKNGKSCLYLKNLNEINLEILATIIELSVTFVEEKFKIID